MRRIIFVFVFVSLMYAPKLYAASVIVEISEIKVLKGKMFIGLAKDPKIFPRIRSSYKWAEVKVRKNVVTYKFKNIPSGVYAISIFHDVNSNRRFDKNAIGIPTEPFGFSKDARGIFGPPSFEKAQFKVNKKKPYKAKITLTEV